MLHMHSLHVKNVFTGEHACTLYTVTAEVVAARQPYQDVSVATGSTELPGWAGLSTDARTAVATAQLLAAALITWESVAPHGSMHWPYSTAAECCTSCQNNTISSQTETALKRSEGSAICMLYCMQLKQAY